MFETIGSRHMPCNSPYVQANPVIPERGQHG